MTGNLQNVPGVKIFLTLAQPVFQPFFTLHFKHFNLLAGLKIDYTNMLRLSFILILFPFFRMAGEVSNTLTHGNSFTFFNC